MRRNITSLTFVDSYMHIVLENGAVEDWYLGQGVTIGTLDTSDPPAYDTPGDQPVIQAQSVPNPDSLTIEEVQFTFSDGRNIGIDWRDTSYGSLALFLAAVEAAIP